MEYKGLVWVSVFLLVVSSVMGANNWFMSGNTDINTEGGTGFTLYGSNRLNSLSPLNITYQKCTFQNSDYEPLIADIDDDDYQEIIVVDGLYIYVYDLECTLEYDITLTNETNGMPVVLDADSDQYYDIIIVTALDYQTIEYSASAGNLVVTDTCNYNPTYTTGHAKWLACFKDGDGANFPLSDTDVCYSYNIDTDDYFSYNYRLKNCGFVANGMNGEGEDAYGTQLISNITFASRSTRINSNEDFLTAQCISEYGAENTRQVTCYQMNADASIFTPQQDNIGLCGRASTSINKINFEQGAYARLGTAMRFFLNMDVYEAGGSGSPLHCTFIYSLGGTELYNTQQQTDGKGQPNNFTSNWAVADYDKDGTNDACFLMTDVNNKLETWFICTDETFENIVEVNITGKSMNFSKGIVLADFHPAYDTLGIGTPEGIFYLNGSNVDIIYGTGYQDHTARTISVVNDVSTGSPFLVFADDTTGFIVRTNITGASYCGDGICQISENEFSCPADCDEDYINITFSVLDNGQFCEDNSDCDSGYCHPTLKQCSCTPYYYACVSDAQCCSLECSENKCTKPTFWNNLDQAKDEQFGDDTNSNNFVALLVMTIIAVAIIVYGRSTIAVVGAGVIFTALAIFFVMVGWLSAFILVGIIIISVVGLIITIMLGTGGE